LGSREEVSCGLLKKARVWESVTPYVAGIHPKSRGPKRADLRSDGGRAAFLREAITHEIRRRDWRLSAVEVIWPSASGERSDARPWEFRRARRKAGDDGWSRPFGLLRLVFADAVDGPVAFGHGCHFGMGLFTPRE
jgi:CRISPR-associated protein Csb2